MSLAQLRETLREKRREISPAERAGSSQQIAEHLSRYLPFRRARTVAFYFAMPEEVDTTPAISVAVTMEKQLYLPVINKARWRKGRLFFTAYEPGRTVLTKNRFGIPEPVHLPGKSIRGTTLDLVCVPLVGFNRNCDRIGMGKGYYDEAFEARSFRNTTLVGLAYDCQEAEFDPAPHDVPMRAIITESGVITST